MNKVFKNFDIRQKIDALEIDNFNNHSVVIIVPLFDESHRPIKECDPVLYQAQKEDASTLLHYIASKQNQGSICILQDGNEANQTDKVFDWVIFLHEFNPYEQEYVLIGLCEKSRNLQMVEMY